MGRRLFRQALLPGVLIHQRLRLRAGEAQQRPVGGEVPGPRPAAPPVQVLRILLLRRRPVRRVLALQGLQIALQAAVIVQVLAVGEVPVCVVLAQLVQILLVVHLLQGIHGAKVLEHHAVLVQVFIIGLLVQGWDDVV